MVFISFLSSETDAGGSEHPAKIQLHDKHMQCHGASTLCCPHSSASKGLSILHDVPKRNTEETVTKNTHLQDFKSMLTGGKIGMALLAACLKRRILTLNYNLLTIVFKCINI